jgi:hypothetical protein
MVRQFVGGMAILALGLTCARAQAGIGASATLIPQQLGPNSYEYSMTLTNTGTTPIGTYWFAWVPGYDLLPSAPTQVKSPTGWTGNALHEAIGVDSIQWVNTVTPLQPGQSLSGFVFDTPDAPGAINGTSVLGLPVKYSYAYIGAPETDPGYFFTVQTIVPEPASMAMGLAGLGLLLRRRPRVLR